MEINYKLCHSNFTNDLRFPVYAGEDGSVVMFDPNKKVWQQINQSHDKTNDYWVVSFMKLVPDLVKPRLEKDVHRIICIAWHGDPIPPMNRVDHLNDNRDDNRACNLKWINSLENAKKAKKHEKQFPNTFNQVIIDCQLLNKGCAVLDAVQIKAMDGNVVTARTAFGHGKGRPPTRISSLLESFYKSGEKGVEKTSRIIAEREVRIYESGDPYPVQIAIQRTSLY